MYLVKTKYGSYLPAYPADQEASAKVKIGDEVKATRARNPMFHRKFMALIRMMFENQDEIQNEEVFRKAMTINAGYFDEVKNHAGVVVPIPRSIAFDSMSAEDFEKLYSAMIDVAAVKLQAAPETIRAELENFM